MRLVGRWPRKSKEQGLDPEALRRATQMAARRPAMSVEEAYERAERINELAVMSLFLHSAGTMEEMLSLFLERSPRVSGAIVTYPLLLDKRRDLLHATPLLNIEDPGLEQASRAANENLVDLEYPMPVRSWRQSVLDAGEVVVFDNLRDAFGDVLGKEACENIRRQLQISKIAAVPLVMEGEVFGLCFFLYSGREPDVEILELTAGHCTLALKELQAGEETTRYGGIDPVTWVHSRGHFLEALEAEVVRSRRYSRGLSLVLFDVDDFSQFNATYGHTLGDRLLRTFAMTLAGSIAAPEMVARYGADELVLLLPETNRMTAVELTASIVRKLAELSLFETEAGETQGISASVAIVSYPEDGATRDELLTAIEIAIEQAKEERRERMKPEKERTPVQRLRLVNRRHPG